MDLFVYQSGHYSIVTLSRPRGLMHKASDLGSEDSWFESWQGRRDFNNYYFLLPSIFSTQMNDRRSSKGPSIYQRGHYSDKILVRPRGLMDKASDFGSEDSRFASWRGCPDFYSYRRDPFEKKTICIILVENTNSNLRSKAGEI